PVHPLTRRCRRSPSCDGPWPSGPFIRTEPMPELITGFSYVDKTNGMIKFCDTYMFPARLIESHVQVHHLRCAGGWAEPEAARSSGPDRYILAVRGLMRVEHGGGVLDVRAGEGMIVRADERVRCSTPGP